MKILLKDNKEIMKKYNYEKNKEIDLDIITSSSSKKIWWVCDKGHEWQASICNTTRGRGCPYCAGKKVLKGYNDLYSYCVKNKRNDLIKEFNKEKNHFSMNQITYGSGKKAWWVCDKGHEWQASITNRTKGTGCPICSGKIVLKGYNDFSSRCPDLVKEFDYNKNKMRPDELYYNSTKKVWWICTNGHSYLRSMAERFLGQGCAICSNKRVLQGYNDLVTTNPKLAYEWHPTKNGDLTPYDVTYGSKKKVWWQCSKGHEWQATLYERTGNNNGCPYCSGHRVLEGYNDLQSKNPQLASEWHPTKNGVLLPSEVSLYSCKIVWWKCSKGHEWKARISHRSSGSGCPYCSGAKVWIGFNDLQSQNSKIANEWNYDKNHCLPNSVSVRSNRVVWWKCSKCNFEWRASVYNRVKNGSGCPNCLKRTHTSFPEQAILYYIRKKYPNAVNSYKDIFDNGMELDIYIPDLKIGIEYDGKRFHKENSIHKEQYKYDICKKSKIKLIRVKENIKQKKNKDCDILIYSKYNNNKYSELDNVLRLISKYIELDNTFNVENDKNNIQAQYLGIIESNSLASKFPKIANEWNYEKNNNLTPSMFYCGSHDIVWWKCDKGHEWKSDIHSRTSQNKGCPYCSGRIVISGKNDLTITHKSLLKEWDFDKNIINPTQVSFGSSKKVWWKCEKGHEWEAAISSRTNRRGCPYCSSNKLLVGFNDLQTRNPSLAEEWDYDKNGNLKPTDVFEKSGKKVWWKCANGHSWQALIYSRTNGNGCPICRKLKK